MLTVTAARNQRGWCPRDHLMNDRISGMIGRTYRDLASLKRAARRLSDSFPTVEYHDGCTTYRYDGSPEIPGRHRAVITDLGPRTSWGKHDDSRPDEF